MNAHRSNRLNVGLVAIFLLSALGGCVTPPPPAETAAAPPVAQATTVVTAPPTSEPQRTAVAPPAPARPRRTVVLLSDDIPEFSTIAREIERRAGTDRLTVLNLDAGPAGIPRIKAQAEGADRIIAIGLLAATVGLDIDSKPLVFCQVFNYRDYDLISAHSKGVNFLPPFELQLQRWTELDPGLRHIGIITGPNQDDLIQEARAAAARHGIDLAVRIVSSDKEALYNFRLLTPEIEGLWLLPDNRILSPEVVRELMAYSARRRKQVVVFGSNLLSAGALMSVTSDAADVAEQVLERLEQVSTDGELLGPPMMPLTKLRVEINPEVARHLDLDIRPTIANSSNP